MLVQYIDGPLKGKTKDVPFITAQNLFARHFARDIRDIPAAVQSAEPEKVRKPRRERKVGEA